MVMRVLTGIFSAAAGALMIYRRANKRSPDGVATSVQEIKQTTNVMLEIGNAVLAVLNALQMISVAKSKLSPGIASGTYTANPVRHTGLGGLEDWS